MLWRRPLISSVVVVPHLDTSSRGYVVPLLASSRHFCLPTSPLFTPGKVHVRITAVDGTAYERDYHEGTSLMEALRDDPTLPVDAAGACNGTCQCSTCHVIMRDHEWFAKAEKLYPVTDTEQDCLDRAPGVTDASRLGCQIILTEDLDGLEVDLPKTTVDLRWQAAAALAISCPRYSTPGKIKVNITVQDGTQLDFSTPTGITLMEAIRDVAQLDMDVSCQKKMRCSICHVYLCDGWYEKIPPPSEEELDTLDQAYHPQDNSRLSCQVRLTPLEDGIVVVLPKHKVDLTMK